MHLQLITLAILSTSLCLGANTAQSQASDNDADMIFVGGEFYTANPRQPWASAVAVRGDTIVCVGDAAGAADFVGPATYQYQMNGALVIPGIIDAHTHPGLVDRYDIHNTRPTAVVMDGVLVHGSLKDISPQAKH